MATKVRKGHLFADCPTGQVKPGQEVCTTCAIRKRRETEPDNWVYKPRSWLDAMNATEIRWQSVKRHNSKPVWADLNAARRDTDPVVWTRQVLLRACNWGVNLDHVPIPLGVVTRRPPKVPVPNVGQVKNPQFEAILAVSQPRAAPVPTGHAKPGLAKTSGFAAEQARLAANGKAKH